MMKITWFFLIFLCVGPFSILADVNVEASVIPQNLPPGDVLDLVVTVQYESTADIQSPRLPNLSDFYLGGQQTSQNISIGNGVVSKEKKYHYSLRPKKEGVFTIGPVEVVVEGKLYKTEPLKVEVSSKFPSRPRSKNIFKGFGKGLKGFFAPHFFDDLEEDNFPFDTTIEDKDLSLDLKTEKQRVYIGEMIVAEWSFSIPENKYGNINYESKKSADIEGFWSEPLVVFGNQPLPPRLERKEGSNYKKQVIQRFALFSVKTGVLTIGSLLVDFHVQSLSFFGSAKVLTKKSQNKKIEVVPLPQSGKNESFTEAVGDFSISAKVNKTQVSSQDPIIYTITFIGRGHPRLIQLPALKFPNSLEVYDITESQKFSVEESKKTFELILIPKEPGKIVIPQFELSTFNPDLGVYTVHVLPTIELNVLGVPAQNKEDGEQYFKNENPVENPVLISESNENPSFFSFDNRRKIWVVLYIFLFLCFAGTLGKHKFFLQKKQKPIEALIGKAEEQVKKHLKRENWKELGMELNQLIYLVLSESTGQNKAIKNLDILIQGLHPSLRVSYESQIRNLVSKLEKLSFAPEQLAKDLRTGKVATKISQQVFALVRKISFT